MHALSTPEPPSALSIAYNTMCNEEDVVFLRFELLLEKTSTGLSIRAIVLDRTKFNVPPLIGLSTQTIQ